MLQKYVRPLPCEAAEAARGWKLSSLSPDFLRSSLCQKPFAENCAFRRTFSIKFVAKTGFESVTFQLTSPHARILWAISEHIFYPHLCPSQLLSLAKVYVTQVRPSPPWRGCGGCYRLETQLAISGLLEVVSETLARKLRVRKTIKAPRYSFANFSTLLNIPGIR